MQDPDASRPVHVTAEERPHPALRKLARACLALAREVIAAGSSTPPASPTNYTEPAKEVKQPGGQEGDHA